MKMKRNKLKQIRVLFLSFKLSLKPDFNRGRPQIVRYYALRKDIHICCSLVGIKHICWFWLLFLNIDRSCYIRPNKLTYKEYAFMHYVTTLSASVWFWGDEFGFERIKFVKLILVKEELIYVLIHLYKCEFNNIFKCKHN